MSFSAGKEEDQKAASGCRREISHRQSSVCSGGYIVDGMRRSSKETSVSFSNEFKLPNAFGVELCFADVDSSGSYSDEKVHIVFALS